MPFLKTEYFTDQFERVVSEELLAFFTKYNKPASLEILAIQLGDRKDLRGEQLGQVEAYINQLTFSTENEAWLLEHTESFCKQRAVYKAIIDSFEIIEGKDKNRSQDAIPSMLSEALAVSFDSSVGHDYLDDFEERYDFYHRTEEKVEFDLDIFNKITKGGLSRKTLNVILAGCVHPNTLVRIRFRKKSKP